MNAEVPENSFVSEDALLHIFALLSAPELLRASSVCRLWHRVAHTSSLWYPVFRTAQANHGGGVVKTIRHAGHGEAMYQGLQRMNRQSRFVVSSKMSGLSTQPSLRQRSSYFSRLRRAHSSAAVRALAAF